jgi:hypothetical protein
MTVEAMAETIRATLTEAGIETLVWNHPPGEPTPTSPPEAQMLIDRLERLYPQPSEEKDAASGKALETTGVHPDPVDNEVWQLIGEMATLMAALAPAMKRRAADLAAGGNAGEVVDKLLKGAEVMHGSGHMYLTWARHYASLNEKADEETQDT